ncbi:transposase [Cucumis melo var. makuwa]|uniref:Transposase n=1 Tax=Cucumis melo var. makuwa TaxID=1194695 RepID=A0A5D3BVS7_CUCMM|nr:transposase [Cucumis melo var. makuwa]
MDRSWMHKSRLPKDYELGVENFISFGFSNTKDASIRCPCLKCGNCEKQSRTTIRDHLYVNGIDESYKIWFWHGEQQLPESSLYEESSKFDTHMYEVNDVGRINEMIEVAHEEYSKDPNEFEKLLNDAEKSLYEGCKKFTKLSTLVKLYNLKVRYGWSDISFSELLKTLKEILPTFNEIPTSIYEAKKTLGALGMSYEKIHACPNDCCLYRKEHANATECPECGESRWKYANNANEGKKQIPVKVVWYFPPIPRFKRLFRSINNAKNLIWHSNERVIGGKLRHPADSPAWKLIDLKWPDFGSEPRNIRLALSADRINPHSEMSSKYSCWPVVIVIYNLPPWLCMKRKFMMLSMLISGPRQPGDDIGTYLAPLIEDLKLLWESGVECYDANQEEIFNLRVVLLWTINDFSAYGNLSEFSVKSIFSLHMEPTIVIDDQDKEVGGAEIDGLVVRVVNEHVEKPKQQRKRGPTIMFDVTHVRSEGERKLVEYNEDGVPIGENGAKLNSFIGSCVHYHIPIIYATWIDVPAELKEKIYTIVETAFIIDNRSRKSILKTAGTAFRQFKHWLTKKYILPFKNEPTLLKRPPYMYSYIDQKQWKEFVRSRLCPHFEDKRKLQQERRKKNKYNHRLSRKGYANLQEELKNIPSEESELGRASMWKKVRVDKKGQYDNEDVQEVVNRIDEISKTCADKESSPNDVLTQALGTRESSGRVRGVGRFVTPSTYFHTAKRSKKRNEEIDKLSDENEKLRFKEVVKDEVNVDVIILNDLQKDAIEVRNEKEVVCEFNMKMSLPLKTILRFAENVMDKDSGIRYQLPFSLFGIGRKTCVLREDIIDFCNMREVKTLTFVAYTVYLHSQDKLSNYIFVGPSLISVGHNTQEVRARNLCSRLMASKSNQLVLAPFNPGAITIFWSQKNIQTSRKQPIWKTVKCPLQVGVVECGYYVMRYMRNIITNRSIVVTDLIDTKTSYSQLELDEVRMELADFLGGHM